MEASHINNAAAAGGTGGTASKPKPRGRRYVPRNGAKPEEGKDKAAERPRRNQPKPQSQRQPRQKPQQLQQNAQQKPQQKQRRRRRQPAKGKQADGQIQTQVQTQDEDSGEICFICVNKIEFYAIADCNHLTCSVCALRLRSKLRDRHCAVCKQQKDRVIVAAAANGIKDFAAFGIWSDVGGPGMDTDHETGMMFDHCRDHFNDMMLMKVPHCAVCKERFPNNKLLTAHLSEQHDRFMCNLCLDNRSIFTNEQEIFTAAELKKHMKQAGQHPLCRFCNRRWFDDQQLYRHMIDAHHTCHLCPVQFQHRYYRDLSALEDHLRSSHFLCEHCNERFVSFSTANEYINHLAAFHNIRRTAPTVNFRVRGAHGEGAPAEQEGEQESFVDMDAPVRARQTRRRGTEPEDNNHQAEGEDSATATSRPRRSQHGIWARTLGSGGGVATPGGEDFPTLPTGPIRAQGKNDRLAKLRADEERARKRRQELELREQRVKELIEAEERDVVQNELLERNKRFAEALGIGRPTSHPGGADPLSSYEEELLRPVYTPDLLKFAQGNMSKLIRVENQMENLIRDLSNNSISLTPMKAQMRSAVQALAKYYNLDSVVYDPEPRRHVCLIKTADSVVPSLLLSDAAHQFSTRTTVPTQAEVDEPVLIFSQLEEGIRGGQLVNKLKELHPDANVVAIRFFNAHSIICEFPTKQDAFTTYTTVQQQLQQAVRSPGEPVPFHVTLGFDPSKVDTNQHANEVEQGAEQEDHQVGLQGNNRWRVESRDSADSQTEWEEFLRSRGHTTPHLAEDDASPHSRFPNSAIRGRLLPRTLPVEFTGSQSATHENRQPVQLNRRTEPPPRQDEGPQGPRNIFDALHDEDDENDDASDWEHVQPVDDSETALSPDQWECPHCTCHNNTHLDRCEACDTRQPAPWQFS